MGARLRKANLRGANLRRANLYGAVLSLAHLNEADLRWADLTEADLTGVNLREADLSGANLGMANFSPVDIGGSTYFPADLTDAALCGAYLSKVRLTLARLRGASFHHADLSLAWLTDTDLRGAELCEANLRKASLVSADVRSADLTDADLRGAYLDRADLSLTKFKRTSLQGASFSKARMRGAPFRNAAVDGETFLNECTVDRKTDFTNVSLDVPRMPPGLRQLLQYNERRRAWEAWYPEHRVLRYPVRLFWQMSDYGRSTGRVLLSFWGCAVLFAIIYYMGAVVCSEFEVGTGVGFIANIAVKDNAPVPQWLIPWRILYFSIVTMTTLGFGDMYAHPQSLTGHILLSIQVMLGYLLLGALITRLAILFIAGGPCDRFPYEERKSTWKRFVQTWKVNWRLWRRGRRR